jgi:hypothetical protein
MMKTEVFSRAFLVAVAFQAMSCGAQDSGTGNTNWRVECSTSDECRSDLICACNRCGPSCDGTIECRDEGDPICVDDESNSTSDDDTDSGSDDAGAPSSSLDCNRFTEGVRTPVDVETTFEVVPGSVGMAIHVWTATADESAVYWQTAEGALYASNTSATEATLLREAPVDQDPLIEVTGTLSNDETLYWTTGFGPPPGAVLEPSPPSPPYRVFALPKTGGETRLLAEFPDEIISPIVALEAGIVVSSPYGSPQGGLSLISDDGEVRALDQMPGYTGSYRVLGADVFFAEIDEQSGGTFFRAPMPDGAPEVAASIDAATAATVRSEFVVAPGMALWVSGETVLEPLTQVDTFRSVDFGTNCVQTLPSVGLSVGQTLIDEHHVYWHSFNALDSSSSSDPLPPMDIIRVDLRTGDLERLITAGLEPTIGDDFITQTATHVYVSRSSDDALLAVRKPE